MIPQECISILYGSQTGCAEDVAYRVRRMALRRGFKVGLSCMNDASFEAMEKGGICIFICSTTGQGEEPDNMKRFWRMMLRKAFPYDLSRVEYAVFGLGDSSYEKFNYPARKLDKRLAQLGAKRFLVRGEGDDQHHLGIDGTLDLWLQDLWTTLAKKFEHMPLIETAQDDMLLPPTFRLILTDSPAMHSNDPAPSKETSIFELRRNERITSSDHFQDSRHVIFEAIDSTRPISFAPGDVAELCPENMDDVVDAFIKHFAWETLAEKYISFEAKDTNELGLLSSRFAEPTTFRTLIKKHLDIFSVPRRSFFEFCAHFASDPLHSEKLFELASAQGQEDLYAYCNRPKRTAWEVLQDFHSVRIPLDYLMDVFGFIRPRQFSIANAIETYPNQVHLAVGIVEYKTILSKPRTGICTSWLSNLPMGHRIPISFRPGTMSLPDDPSIPVIMIAPGLGIAPMRSFIQKRIAMGATQNVVFFGCRNAAKDFYFESEFRALEQSGTLKLFTAFSRDQALKRYVWHIIQEEQHFVWDLIHQQDAYIFLSGNANRMPTDVKNALVQVFQEQGNLSEQDALLYFLHLKKIGRYQEECWY